MANQYVTHREDGRWQVRAEGALRATQVFDTQREAIARANEIGRNQRSEVTVMGMNGQIRQKQSYGNDPCPPRDKR